MAGLKITIPGLVSDTSLPIRRDDPILTEGSLVLVQPNHDISPWVSGVPSQGYNVPNLAEAVTRKIIPAGNINPIFDFQGDLGANGLYERTDKGGFHTIITQTTDIGANNGLSIYLPDAIMQYMIDNSDHDFYFSIWGNITRAALTTDPDAAKTMMEIAKSSASGRIVLISHTASQRYPSGAEQLGQYFTGVNSEGAQLFSLAGTPQDLGAATLSDFPTSNHRALAQFGTVELQNDYDPIRTALQSWVLYRIYVEDLTVSQRTFDEVSTIDKDLYQREVLSDGGKYYGDTFTDPVTIP